MKKEYFCFKLTYQRLLSFTISQYAVLNTSYIELSTNFVFVKTSYFLNSVLRILNYSFLSCVCVSSQHCEHLMDFTGPGINIGIKSMNISQAPYIQFSFVSLKYLSFDCLTFDYLESTMNCSDSKLLRILLSCSNLQSLTVTQVLKQVGTMFPYTYCIITTRFEY